MLRLENNVTGVALNLPTKIEEVGMDYFEEVLKDIEPSEFYCIVAILYRERLNVIVDTNKHKGDLKSSVLPIIVKVSKGADENLLNKVPSIDDASLMRAKDLNVANNKISIGNVTNHCKERNLFTMITTYTIYNKPSLVMNINNTIVTSKRIGFTNEPESVFVEFKIIPITDIKCIMPIKSSTKCKFIDKCDINIAIELKD